MLCSLKAGAASREDEGGLAENSPEDAELAALTDVIEAYERQRWPEGNPAPQKVLWC